MTELPEELREYLSAPSLQAVWRSLRERLQRRGLQLIGSISIPLDDERADRLGGLLGRNLASGRTVQISLLDLDTALRRSAAQRGLAAVVADLTGAPLRDRIGERETARAELNRLWAELDVALVDAGLASEDWVVPWTDWLRRGGVITRLPPPVALDSLRPSVWILNDLLNRTSGTDNLATLATLFTGSAHGLDDGTPTAALVLRGLAQALDVPAPSTPSERRALWHRVGIATDEISGTVLVWALRPPGTDRWSAMMRERADLGLITHLTTHELQRAPELTTPGGLVHACENPQVLQQLAAAEQPPASDGPCRTDTVGRRAAGFDDSDRCRSPRGSSHRHTPRRSPLQLTLAASALLPETTLPPEVAELRGSRPRQLMSDLGERRRTTANACGRQTTPLPARPCGVRRCP
jgi:uncharacterized protein (TIGR02679 family)